MRGHFKFQLNLRFNENTENTILLSVLCPLIDFHAASIQRKTAAIILL